LAFLQHFYFLSAQISKRCIRICVVVHLAFWVTHQYFSSEIFSWTKSESVKVNGIANFGILIKPVIQVFWRNTGYVVNVNTNKFSNL
jgi:hypothetical protein